MDWINIFDEAEPEPGATNDEISQFVLELFKPLTDKEIAEINAIQHNPFSPTDPSYYTYKPSIPHIGS